MSENQKEIGKERYPAIQLQAAASNPTPGSDAGPHKREKQSRTVSRSSGDKMIDLAELKENERRFRTVFEAAPIGIAIASPQGYFLRVNDCFAQMLGYNHNEIRQYTFLDITHPEDRPDTTRLSQQVRDGKHNSYRTEKRFLRKDGQSIRIIVRATAIRAPNGDIKYWLGLIENITERKKAEKAIRKSEEKYRIILESMEEGYFEVDLEGNYTFFNASMCNILGYAADELIAKNNRDYASPQTAKKLIRIFNQVYETGRSARVLNYEVITKDGTKKILYLSASLIRDDDQKPLGFRGIVQDVTDQLIAEKQREQLASQMLNAQKMEAIGTLAGGIAHDFNNLLMGFQGNLSLMLMDVNPKHPHYDYLLNMENHVKRGSELTRQILGFARGGKYEVKPTDLNDLLEKSSEMFSRTRKEISIHKKFQEGLWSVEVDRGQIEQVLLNLFVNAWQAMPSGGKFFIETQNLVLEEGDYAKPYALNPGKYVRISVTDTGIGMDKNTLERIFEPFFTTKEVGRGTGLGLASAYGIIKNHNGVIDVDSEKDRGSTFRIYLPVSHKEVIKDEASNEKALKGRETILLVDDEEMIAEIGKKMLERLGYSVLLAESGEKALQTYEAHRDSIDLIILDMIMPDMGGSVTYDQLKAKDPDIRVLLSSGYSLNGQASQIMRRGCDGFIQKPFNLEQISKKIREILDNTT
ncbi:PAS/PAC sensor hybrid histidine kinase [Olavius sp. associated proteobacterium Delta 1]|nr:PAS/PAC sensor hybrid histidine kinase [Olavius sp. associated proteobacterium Delta 1]